MMSGSKIEGEELLLTASRSYDIEAARLKGVPQPGVQRARQVLDQLAA